MSKRMGRPPIYRTAEEKKKAHRLRIDLHNGLTLEYALLNKEERRAFILDLMEGGEDDAEICRRTGLSLVFIQRVRIAFNRPPECPPGEESEAGIKLDDGAYMAAVRRLKLAPPPSWRFGRDLCPMPSRPIVIRTHTAAGWCAEEGEDAKSKPFMQDARAYA